MDDWTLVTREVLRFLREHLEFLKLEFEVWTAVTTGLIGSWTGDTFKELLDKRCRDRLYEILTDELWWPRELSMALPQNGAHYKTMGAGVGHQLEMFKASYNPVLRLMAKHAERLPCALEELPKDESGQTEVVGDPEPAGRLQSSTSEEQVPKQTQKKRR